MGASKPETSVARWWVAAAVAVFLLAMILQLRGSNSTLPKAAVSTQTQAADSDPAGSSVGPEELAGLEAPKERADPQERLNLPSALGPAKPAAETTRSTPVKGLVRLVIEDNSWLAEDVSGYYITWGQDAASQREVQATDVDPHGGTFLLPSAPASVNEFSLIRLDGLLAKPVQLRSVPAPAPTGSPHPDKAVPSHELTVALEAGATLDWAPSVSTANRTSVTVSLGSASPPHTREVSSFSPRTGLVDSIENVELPLTLPSLQQAEIVWVCAEGMQWRGFNVEPGAERIEVALAIGATIHVLHDEPDAGEELYAWAMEFPSGNVHRKRIDETGRTTFESRPSGAHRVWISRGMDRQDPLATRIVELDLEPGEVIEVDLTTWYAQEHLASLRVRLDGAQELLSSASTRDLMGQPSLGVEAFPISLPGERVSSSPSQGSAPTGRQYARELEAVASNAAVDTYVFQREWLEPGHYRIVARPFAAASEVTLVAGETAEVSINIGELGRVVFNFPDAYASRTYHGWVQSAVGEPKEGALVLVSSGSTAGNNASQHGLSLAPGVYTARLSLPGRRGGAAEVALISDDFSVTTGNITTVELREQPKIAVQVEAVDSATLEPIDLGFEFWARVSIASSLTGKELPRKTELVGTDTAFTGVKVRLTPPAEAVTITPPDSPFWTFDRVEPAVVEEGTKFVLRGVRK